MCTLAHVFEAAGLSTVSLVSVRPVAERMQPPRALYGQFPLGRPLGRPEDADFQHDVLARALSLLDHDRGPVLANHPVVIEADETPMACTLPPRFDPDAHPAVDEAGGIRKAWERTRSRRGTTSVGRALGPDEVGDALAAFQRIVDGTEWKDAAIPGGNPIAAVHDIRAYYEEAALELVDGPTPGGRAAEAWFYERTEAGKTIMAARSAMKAAGAPQPLWFYLAPAHR